ncbi:RNA pyrophosphohydrolase [Aquimixticola soesokkakensis]|uniref:RNA pyrophosphohydrolase n=1 Tax=Aquimixticola soesokkakensis TaxID=1519096 RepID=A0A1Y5R928_9RHOB|nr:NUDIX hydrolase [Aquimixticola soesokkakensis]SLN11262.1 RNA pyrophosphohydrolase [Aquimixticola soesokkakensis]
MIRRYGETPKKGQIYGRRPGAYAVLRRGPDLLLTFQDGPTPEFQLPGGGIDQGEHILPALRREVFEETGWAIGAAQRLAVFRRFAYLPEYDRFAEKICHIFLATPALRRGPPIEPLHSAIWVPMAQAPDLLGNDGDRAVVENYLKFCAI